jgi:hypothetical protein
MERGGNVFETAISAMSLGLRLQRRAASARRARTASRLEAIDTVETIAVELGSKLVR